MTYESPNEEQIVDYIIDSKLNDGNDEQLFVGNLHTIQGGNGNWHKWTMFVSTSRNEIKDPVTIKSVTYHLHPSFRPPNKLRATPPFFLTCTGWGVFQIDITIKFKTYRKTLITSHQLSFDAPTTITDVSSNRRYYIEKLYDHPKLKERDVIDNTSRNKSFVSTTKKRLLKSMIELTPKLVFENFRLRNKQFIQCLKNICDKKYGNINTIPSTIYNIISMYALLSPYSPINTILPTQSIEISNCNSCNIVINSNKIKNLLISNCRDINIKFNSILTMIEIHYSSNISTICNINHYVYTYRIENSNNINCTFSDDGNKVYFLNFDSKNTVLKVGNINGKIDNNQICKLPNDIQRISARWRGRTNIPNQVVFTVKQFKPTRAHRFE